MKYMNNKRQSPPPRPKPQESLSLMREIYRAYTAELAAITDYTYAKILLEKDLPAAAELFAAIAMTEMKHYETLGRLLHGLSAPHAPRVCLQGMPYRLLEDADSHAPVVAEQIAKDRLRDEKNAKSNYERLAMAATTEQVRSTLLALSADEGEHAAALEAMQLRLSGS